MWNKHKSAVIAALELNISSRSEVIEFVSADFDGWVSKDVNGKNLSVIEGFLYSYHQLWILP